MGGDRPRTIRSVERAIEIIDALEREGSLGVTELSDMLGVAKGTVHTHLTTLSQAGYVTRSNGTYRLSLRFLGLAQRVKERIGIYDLVVDQLDQLAAVTGERTQFAMPENNRAIYVYRAEGEDAIRSSVPIGQYEYLHCVAIGKAMLAYFPDSRIDRVVDQVGLPAVTDGTITDCEELKEELAEIRRRGYAVDDQERVRGIRCIAAPLRTESGEVFGAISISGPARRMTDEQIESELREVLLRTTNVIEVNAELSRSQAL